MQPDIDWDFANPFTLPIQVQEMDLDRLGHANNVVYLRWLEEISWAHVEHIGMTWALQESLGRAMAIVRTEIDYLAAAMAGDELVLATWLVQCDRRLRTARRFQLWRPRDGVTLVRALSRHVCIDVATQRPARMPVQFADILCAELSS